MVEKLKDGQNANQLQQSSSTFLLEPTDFTHPPIPTNKEAIQKPRQKYDAAMIPRNVMPSDPFLEALGGDGDGDGGSFKAAKPRAM